MKKVTTKIEIDELQLDELPVEEQELVNAAIEATNNSYAPYSKFNVGAAIRLHDNQIVRGANQENAAFPVSLCAERTAIFAAQAQHPELSIDAIAIAAKNENGLLAEPVSPCGSCRQVMMQMEDRYQNNMTVLLYGQNRIYRLKTVKDLLPLYFVDENMR